jgi:Fe-S-cluster containining protein
MICGSGLTVNINSLEMFLTTNDTNKIVENGFSDLIENLNGYHMKIIDGQCAALQNGECVIRDIAPTVCKSYPDYTNIFIGTCECKFCPGCGGDKLAKMIELAEDIIYAEEIWKHYAGRIT